MSQGVTTVTHVRTRTWLGAVGALMLGILVVLLLVQASSDPALAGKPRPTPTPTPTMPASLAVLATDASPWLHLEANSLQPSPLYLGSTPYELVFGVRPADGGVAKLPATLKAIGDTQIKGIRQTMISKKIITAKQTLTLEVWPIREYRGRLTWAVARWRTSSANPWRWVDPSYILNTDPNTYVPEPLDPMVPADYTDIFGAPDDYGWNVEPQFSTCIWVKRGPDMSQAPPMEAWLPSSLAAAYSLKDLSDRAALVLSPPARLNGKPTTYTVVTVKATGTTWPSSITWTADQTAPAPLAADPIITSWPADFDAAYRADLLSMDGEAPAVFPISHRQVTFTNKQNALPDNQLEYVFQYLEERYAQMSIATTRQSFTWRGMPQTNLIAKIPGSNPSLAPVLMADHVDTAFCENDAIRGIYRAVPGADDNASASAALLRAAVALKDRHPLRTIWLVHFTGEEFPADDLGARALVSKMLGDKQDIAGMVLLDMIGFAGTGQPQVQINPGTQAASLKMASIALDAAADQAPDLMPLLRLRFDDRSYLYNTDGLILSDNGYPVVLINEYINYYSRLMRAAYHDMSDTSDKVDFPFAEKLTKISIETVARMAEVPAQ
jgi:hypothetical protein